MQWLVVGANGMLGTDLVAMLTTRGERVSGIDREQIDITDAAATADLAAAVDVVVNCAAYTAVDAAEGNEDTAFTVNAVGAANIARAARSSGARLVHVSTDYVFSGRAAEPYPEDFPLDPLTAYGRTKAAGEWAVRAECPDHLVVRTAWLYGAAGACFPRTIASAARERGRLEVVEDQIGQPTWTMDLAALIADLVTSEAPAGTYHGTASGKASWFEFARAVVSAAGLDPRMIHPTSSAGYVRPAKRPAFSVLGHDALRRIGVAPIGPWDARWAAAAESVLASGPG